MKNSETLEPGNRYGDEADGGTDPEADHESLRDEAADEEAEIAGTEYSSVEITDLIGELDELEKTRSFLYNENTRLKSRIDILTGELEGLRITATSENARASLYEKERRKSLEHADQLRRHKDALINEIGLLHMKIKSIRREIDSSHAIDDSLREELKWIDNEKSIILKRLDTVQTGLARISENRRERIPNFKWYDSVLKQMYTQLKDTQNRMEVSILLNK